MQACYSLSNDLVQRVCAIPREGYGVAERGIMRNCAKKLRIWAGETWQKLSQALPIVLGACPSNGRDCDYSDRLLDTASVAALPPQFNKLQRYLMLVGC